MQPEPPSSTEETLELSREHADNSISVAEDIPGLLPDITIPTKVGLFRDPRRSERKAVEEIVRRMLTPEGTEYVPSLETQRILEKF